MENGAAHPSKGSFIVFEGVEGSGKSTALVAAATYLRGATYPVTETREPGATEIGKSIRSVLLDHKNTAMTPKAELFLFAADRAQHIAQVVKPALERGEHVLCDRYIYSNFAYQGFGRGIDLGLLRTVNSLATESLLPDLVILFDLDPKIGLERAKSRVGGWTRFEADTIQFHSRVRDGFLKLAADDSSRFSIIDASQSVDKVASETIELLKKRMSLREQSGK